MSFAVHAEARSAELSQDERALLDQARAVAAAPLEDFSLLGANEGARDPGYRYQLAFLGYGLVSVADAAPELKPEAARIFARLVEKMERPETLAYWRDLGYPGDPLTSRNVMYRGHLALLYGLARDRFGERRFDAKFHALARALHDEITAPTPLCCEPDEVFVQCNSVVALALFLHDRAFGTGYADAAPRLLAWARERMPLEGTSLVREDYRPSTGKSSARQAGYANAWTIAFLAPIPGTAADARAMWADWKRLFAAPSAAVGVARGAPEGEPLSLEESASSALLATLFGAVAAREMGDEALHRDFARTAALVAEASGAAGSALPAVRRAQGRTFRTIALFARVHRGWGRVLRVAAEF